MAAGEPQHAGTVSGQPQRWPFGLGGCSGEFDAGLLAAPELAAALQVVHHGFDPLVAADTQCGQLGMGAGHVGAGPRPKHEASFAQAIQTGERVC